MKKYLFDIGDKLLVLLKEDNSKHIVEISDVDKSNAEYPYEFKCLYAYYYKFNSEWVNTNEIEIIKKVTDSDIDSFLKENDIKYKIGDEVYYDSKHQTISAYDFKDEEYLLNESKDWVSEDCFEEDILKYSIDDIIVVEDNGVKSILQITDLDPSDNTYKVKCLYGNYMEYHCEWIDADIIKESLDSEELEDLLEDKGIMYRIGQYLFYKGERCKVSCYDTSDKNYEIELSNYRETWAAECDLLEHTFSVGDLVKIKNYPKTILKIDNLCDDGDIEVSCVVGSYGDIEKGYYRGNELESATQAEVDILQKDYTFKVGEKVLYGEDGTEDYILNIDTSDNNYPYQLGESFDYVSETDISKIGEKVEEVFVGLPIKDSKTGKVTLNWKTEEEVKKEAEIPIVEKVEEIKPRRRMLLG